MKTLLMLAALGAAAPALAADPKMPTPEATTSANVQPAASEKTRYCVMVEPVTGTRISTRVCQTRADWLKEGFDPLARKK